MIFLKQSTQCTIAFGPFVDKTDGVTLLTNATTITDIDHATTGIFLSKNGANAAVRHQGIAAASVADDYGMMTVTLDATDTGTVGSLDVLFAKAATYLPVHKSFMILPANVYDSLMGTDLLDVNAAQWLGTACHAATENGTPCVEVVRWGGNDIAATAINGTPKVDISGYRGTAAHTETTAGLIPAELHQILGQTVTCAAGVTILASVGTPTADTAQSGDAYAIVNNGTYGNSALHTEVAKDSTVSKPGTAQTITANQSVNVAQWLGTNCHAATVNGIPVVQLHDSAGAGGVNAPANFEDMSITDTTGLVDITQTAADKAWGTAARVLTANTNLADLAVDVTKIHGTAITETGSGYIAGSFTKFFDKQTPTGTINSLPDAVAGANGGLPTTNGTKISQTVDLTTGQTIAATVAGNVGGISGVTFPANFEHLSITDNTGLIDLTQTAADKVWGTTVRVLTAPTNLTGMSVVITRPTGVVVTDGSNTTTDFKTDLSSSETDYIKDAYLKFTSGANINQVKKIAAYNGSTKFVTVAAFTDAPAGSDAFVIINE